MDAYKHSGYFCYLDDIPQMKQTLPAPTLKEETENNEDLRGETECQKYMQQLVQGL